MLLFWLAYFVSFPVLRGLQLLLLDGKASTLSSLRGADAFLMGVLKEPASLVNIALALAALLLMTGFWALLVYRLYYCIKGPGGRPLGVLFWLLGLVAAMLLNQTWFPHSEFVLITSDVPSKGIWPELITMTIFGLPLAVFLWKRHLSLALLCLFPLGLYALDTALYRLDRAIVPEIGSNNIVLIGVDSLRPDLLYGAGADKLPMSELRRVVEQGEHFSNAWTPTARTYVSWSSVLSGQSPESSGIRFNLSSVEQQCELVRALEADGFTTVYGSDEKQFSHIGAECRFQHETGAPDLALDFMFSKLLDMPFINLVARYPYLGRYVLPHNVINRALC